MDSKYIATIKVEDNNKRIEELNVKKKFLQKWRSSGNVSIGIEFALIALLGVVLCVPPFLPPLLTIFGVLTMALTSIVPISSLVKFSKIKKEIADINNQISLIEKENVKLKEQLSQASVEKLNSFEDSKKIKKVELKEQQKQTNNELIK